MSCNRILETGIDEFVQTVHKFTKLQRLSLDISANLVYDKNLRDLGVSLGMMKSLRKLTSAAFP